PAPKGTMILTVRVGYSSAAAPAKVPTKVLAKVLAKVPARAVRAIACPAIGDMGPPGAQFWEIGGAAHPPQTLGFPGQAHAEVAVCHGVCASGARYGVSSSSRGLLPCSPPSAPLILRTSPTWSF